MKKTNTLLSLLATASMGHAAIVTYTPSFDAGTFDNTSGTTAYDVNGTGLGEGITSGVASYTDTYFFTDSTTGINFNVDFTFAASGGDGVLGVTPGSTGTGIGVQGATFDWIDEGEAVTITVSDLVVDTSGYIDGSISGLNGPVGVGSFALGIQQFSIASLNAADGPVAGDGTTTDIITANPYDFGSTLSNSTGTGSLAFVDSDLGANDTRVRLSAWQPYIEIDIVAVPEPSSIALLGVGVAGLLISRRRK